MKKTLPLLLPFCFSLLIGTGHRAQAQGVGIGTTSPDAAAALDVKSTNQGFLPPRMTQSQRGQIPVTSQSAGLLVYQTDGTAGYYYYTGLTWMPLGATGPAGPQGPQGATGPQGPAGTLGSYGDGSGGALALGFGNTLDLTTTAGFNTLTAQGKNSLQFTDLTINGTLIVPSGTVIRATGNVTITGTGTIVVTPGTSDSGNGAPHPGVSTAAPGDINGGIGLSTLAASKLTLPGPNAGGAGNRNTSQGAVTGGEGGGSFVLIAGGNITLATGSAINANGNAGINPGGSVDIPGPGGGAGGIIVLCAKGTINQSGTLRALGGSGGPGVNGNGGVSGAGGGGGGGGGIIHLIASAAIQGSNSTQVSGGAAGTDANSTSTNQPGGGGGACGGNGGSGGSGNPAVGQTFVGATAGAAGYSIQTITPNPENLVH